MTSWSPDSASFWRDEYWFMNLETQEISSWGIVVKIFSWWKVEVAGINVGSLTTGSEIKTRDGKFYVETTNWDRAFSKCFQWGVETFRDDRIFIQQYELTQQSWKDFLNTLGV